jgi:hypothetical protein
MKNTGGVLFHVAVIAVSAFIALSLPGIVTFVAQNLLVYWSFIGNEKIFLVSVEIALAIFLILFTHRVRGNWKERKISKMAQRAGFVQEMTPRSFLTRQWARKMKVGQGFGREVLLLGSTGWRTFGDPRGEFHLVLRNCREAKIMLLDPCGDGAKIRAKSILDPEITPESFGEQIRKSIDFLKELKAVQKDIRLKLYPDPPLFKLAILGDYLWIKHYHTDHDVQAMPEFLFHHNQKPASMYIPFYHYFLSRWNQPGLPEYDLETDELIYRDDLGTELKREKFNRKGAAETGIVAEDDSIEAGAVFHLPPLKGISFPSLSFPEILGQTHYWIHQKALPKGIQLFGRLKKALKT